jgi:hypothetical protein
MLHVSVSSTAGQRQWLVTLGRAWSLLETRKKLEARKMHEMRQNPQRLVDALLGAICTFTQKFLKCLNDLI